ncbi:hypothetical protein ONS95_007509 [Cadophora gregata]|uniref:uncharacterized protein n=1 Tax=Cadophora gregata TaxID=51156 RepID=UPI0026DCCA64|nr:uncharacterized protein ONS95_007509 [Cadophora gregata]KAK0118625.1 hypothetical protein ONS96_011715 [Cadophora gregata f. sp. sojae]KAK0125883.1 hypothetical protein ONS95_007509 [Cadophora gregata]
MSSSFGKQKGAMKESSPQSGYPSLWSEWGWDDNRHLWKRYRLDSNGSYECDYSSPQEEDYSAVRNNQLANEHASYSSSQQTLSSYQVAPFSSVMTNAYRRESQDKSSDRRVPVHSIHITTSNPSTDYEELDKKYKIHSSKAFRFGRVFKILWSEQDVNHETGGYHDSESIVQRLKSGGTVLAPIRRFLIVEQQIGHCKCLPIMTYGGKGLDKRGIHIDDHAEIYSGKRPFYTPGEKGMTKHPVKSSCTKGQKLDTPSLLNYAKVYTVEHNVKACFIGQIDETSERHVAGDYKDTHLLQGARHDDSPSQDADGGPLDSTSPEMSAEEVDKQSFQEDVSPSIDYGQPGLANLSLPDQNPYVPQSIAPSYLNNNQDSSSIVPPDSSAEAFGGHDAGEKNAKLVNPSTSAEKKAELSKKRCTGHDSVWRDYVLPASNAILVTYLVGRELSGSSGGSPARDPADQSSYQRSLINAWRERTGDGASVGSWSRRSDRVPSIRSLE